MRQITTLASGPGFLFPICYSWRWVNSSPGILTPFHRCIHLQISPPSIMLKLGWGFQNPSPVSCFVDMCRAYKYGRVLPLTRWSSNSSPASAFRLCLMLRHLHHSCETMADNIRTIFVGCDSSWRLVLCGLTLPSVIPSRERP